MRYSKRLRWDLESNRLAETVARLKRDGIEFADLTNSNPTQAGIPYPEDWFETLGRDPGGRLYDPDPRGLETTREAVAHYYADLGAPVSPDRILLTASTSEAYSFALKLLCDPGDEILTPRPSYPLFEFLAGLELVETVDYDLATPDFDRWISERTRAIVVVHPNNPTGEYVKRDGPALPESIAVISDEVFFDYALAGDPRRHPTFAGPTNGLTFTLSGLSKVCGLPQMKLGWIVVSGPEPEARLAYEQLELIADTYLSVNTPVQLAAMRWIPERRRIQEPILRRMRENLAALEPLKPLAVEGGWTALIPATELMDVNGAAILLDKQHVLVQPGTFFGITETPCAVISLLTNPELLRRSIAALAAC